MQQKRLQLVFIALEPLFDIFQGWLEVGNDFPKEVVTDPFAQAETHNMCQFIHILSIFNLADDLRHVNANACYQINTAGLHFIQSGSPLRCADANKRPFD